LLFTLFNKKKTIKLPYLFDGHKFLFKTAERDREKRIVFRFSWSNKFKRVTQTG